MSDVHGGEELPELGRYWRTGAHSRSGGGWGGRIPGTGCRESRGDDDLVSPEDEFLHAGTDLQHAKVNPDAEVSMEEGVGVGGSVLVAPGSDQREVSVAVRDGGEVRADIGGRVMWRAHVQGLAEVVQII